MTTDERIDRLTERHEALTQSVELLLQTTREHSQQITELMEAAASLLHVAEIHEQRISRLEGKGSQQQ
jgi:ABC-type transporter Mla subunit MlaD